MTGRKWECRSKALKQRWGKERGLSDDFLMNFLQNGILPSEGAEVLSRILESDQPRIMVSTMDLKALMQNNIATKQAGWGEVRTPTNQDTKCRGSLRSPQPTEQGDSDSASFENETQRTLAEIWQKLLGIQKIEICGNFFDLGGHSLIAVRLISQIEECMGVRIAPAEIYSYPTIKELAAQIQSKSGSPRQPPENFKPPMVGIQPYGEKTPFFFMHAAEGNVFCYNELSRELGMNQPFYGLKAFGIAPDTSPLSNVKEIVETYTEAIRKVQPKGPYILGGHCLGGAIAYEIAQHLRKQGEDISHLIIIDGYAPPLFQHVLPKTMK